MTKHPRYADTRYPGYREAHREAALRYYHRQKAKGLCTQCPASAVEGRTMCVTCAELNREQVREYADRVRAKGAHRRCGLCRLPGHNRSTCADRSEAEL